jgi:hypothetical protein
MCGTRGHRNGKTRSSLSTTTILRLTGPLNFRSFWQRTAWQWSPIPILSRSGPLWLFPIPQAKALDERSKIWHHWRDSSGISAGTWHDSKKGNSRDASKHGSNAGTTVFVRKGSTLKLLEEFNIQGKQTSFYKYCPGTCGYILVYEWIIQILVSSVKRLILGPR